MFSRESSAWSILGSCSYPLGTTPEISLEPEKCASFPASSHLKGLPCTEHIFLMGLCHLEGMLTPSHFTLSGTQQRQLHGDDLKVYALDFI